MDPGDSGNDYGVVLPVGSIDIFIGYISTSTEGSIGLNGAATAVADDAGYCSDASDGYAESIYPLFDDVLGGGSDDDLGPISNGKTDPASVFMAGNEAPNPLTTPVTPDNAAARAAEIEAYRLARPR